MAQQLAVTSVGFIGSGRLAERVARDLVKKIAPQQKFCYRKQRLVSTLLASDPSRERREVFDTLGFTTTDANQRVLADCDLVFLGTSAPDALEVALGGASARRQQVQQTLFVSLMGDLPADQLEQMLYPGAKVIRMMPHNYLEQQGLPEGVLPPSSWATVRGTHVSSEDVEQVLALTGISNHVEVNETARANCPDPPVDSREGVIHRIVRSINERRAAAMSAAYSAAAGVSAAAASAARSSAGAASGGARDDARDAAEFSELYEMGELLGRGQFSQVFRATHRETGEAFAVKCLRDDRLTKEGREMLVAEVGALNRLTHANVIGHHGFFSENGSYYLVLDMCHGGGLEHVVKARRAMPEAHVKHVMRQVLSALEYCHAMGQIHRDVKAENVLLSHALDSDSADSVNLSQVHVKLADFGLSEELELASGRLQQICGTPQYLSPELVSGRGYGKPADIWAAGILSYMLLSGKIPFDEALNEQDLYKRIGLGAIWFSPRDWSAVSRDAQDVVHRMLDISPDSRATASELLQHAWFQES